MIDIILGALALGLLWAIMTIGVFCTYRILDIADMTVEGSITLGAAIAASMIANGANPYFATLAAFCGGLAAGACTSLLYTKLKIPALLSGILTMLALYSINLRVMGKANVPLLKVDTVFSGFVNMGLNKNVAVIVFGAIAVALIVALLYWFFGTELGCAIRATGSNPRMVRAQGADTDNMQILGVTLANGLVALSGALIAQYQSFADVKMGIGSIVIGLASVIIGEVLFGKGNFLSKLCSLVIGAVVYRMIIAMVLKLGMDADDLKLFTALTVVICLSLPTLQNKFRAAARARKEDARNA